MLRARAVLPCKDRRGKRGASTGSCIEAGFVKTSEHDPEKWERFRKDPAQKKIERDDDSQEKSSR